VKIAEYDRAIAQAARDDARSKRLMKLLASARSPPARCWPAWAVATTSITTSGGGVDRPRAGTIQQRRQGAARADYQGRDSYLRSLLVMGARAVLNSIGDKQDRFSRWARALQERRGYWRA